MSIDVSKNLSIEQHDRKSWSMSCFTYPTNMQQSSFEYELPRKYTIDIKLNKSSR